MVVLSILGALVVASLGAGFIANGVSHLTGTWWQKKKDDVTGIILMFCGGALIVTAVALPFGVDHNQKVKAACDAVGGEIVAGTCYDPLVERKINLGD